MDKLNIAIEEMGLTIRSRNLLLRAGCRTAGDILRLPDEKPETVARLGLRFTEAVFTRLAALGFTPGELAPVRERFRATRERLMEERRAEIRRQNAQRRAEAARDGEGLKILAEVLSRMEPAAAEGFLRTLLKAQRELKARRGE